MKNYDKEFEDIVSNSLSDRDSKLEDPRKDPILRGVLKWLHYEDLSNESDSLSDRELDFYTDQENLIHYLSNQYKITEEEARNIYEEIENNMYPTIQDMD